MFHKNKKIILATLTILVFAPALNQYFTTMLGNYMVGLLPKVIIHIGVPIFGVWIFTGKSVRKSFLTPLLWKDTKIILKQAAIGSCLAAFFIIGAFITLNALIDFSAISTNLKNNYGVTVTNYLFVATMLIIFNPFLEEYFWRGFIFRVYNKYTTGAVNWLLFFISGFLFSLHHVVITTGWFNWWQFLLVTLFLALAGVYFNWLYKITNSIYAPWIIHTVADFIIVIIGFFILF